MTENENGSEIYSLTYTDLHTAQNPDYHRVNLNCVFGKSKPKFDYSTGVSLVNVLNRINIFSSQYYVDYRFEEIQQNLFVRTGLGFTPEIFVRFRIRE